MIAYTALFSALLSRLIALACGSTWVTSFIERFCFVFVFLNIHRSGVLTALAWLVPHETAAISVRSVYSIQPCTCHFMQSHIRKVHACLAVTCHLYFRQNDRDLLRATAVTFPFLSDRNPLRTPSDQTTRHFFSQSERPAMFSVPGCCLPPPQVCLLSV